MSGKANTAVKGVRFGVVLQRSDNTGGINNHLPLKSGFSKIPVSHCLWKTLNEA